MHISEPLYSSGGLITARPKRGRVWYVDPTANNGGGGGDSWDEALVTMAAAVAQVQSGDTIYFIGNIREQVVAPDNIFDVSIIGCGNTPRNSDLVATGYGPRSQTSATWKAPASPVALTPLMEVRHQGWTFENILFNAPTDAADVKLVRNALTGASEDDASHASFYGCRFVGGNTGIEDSGGCYNVTVESCEFFNITDGTGRAIYCSSVAVANPLYWKIINNRFLDNDNHIVAAASKWLVKWNVLSSANVTAKINFTGGVAGNLVTMNTLGGTYSIAGGYTGAGGADEWYGNWSSTSPTVSDPA